LREIGELKLFLPGACKIVYNRLFEITGSKG
jgi:hypothetical protein